MMKIKLLIITWAILLGSNHAYAATQQILMGCDVNNFVSNVTTEYSLISGIGDVSSWTATETERQEMFAAAGTLSDLRVEMDSSPGTSNSYKFTIRVNGAEPGSPTTCTLSNAETVCTDTTNPTTISIGDVVTIESVPTSSPTQSHTGCSIAWNPTTADETVLFGGGGENTLGADNNTRYIALGGNWFHDGAETDVAFLASTPGVFKNMYVVLGTAPDNGASSQTQTFTFRDSASAESIDCTITEAETSCNSTLESETATASTAERFVIVRTATNTPALSTYYIGIIFDPTTEGEFLILAPSYNALSLTATEYMPVSAPGPVWGATENQTDNLYGTGDFATAMTFEDMYVWLKTDPGATGDIFTFSLRDDGGTTDLVATCNGVQACSDTATVSPTQDSRMGVMVVPTDGGTLAATSVTITYTGYIPPTAEAVTDIFMTGGGVF